MLGTLAVIFIVAGAYYFYLVRKRPEAFGTAGPADVQGQSAPPDATAFSSNAPPENYMPRVFSRRTLFVKASHPSSISNEDEIVFMDTGVAGVLVFPVGNLSPVPVIYPGYPSPVIYSNYPPFPSPISPPAPQPAAAYLAFDAPQGGGCWPRQALGSQGRRCRLEGTCPDHAFTSTYSLPQGIPRRCP